jgi:hypothetical protein
MKEDLTKYDGAFVNKHMLHMFMFMWQIHPWSFVNMKSLDVYEYFDGDESTVEIDK